MQIIAKRIDVILILKGVKRSYNLFGFNRIIIVWHE